jgi:hypothetical protein
MKIKKYSAIILSLVIELTGLSNISGQAFTWKGVIEKGDGITIIKNPEDPIYGIKKYDLEEDLKIGREENENYTFFKIRGVAVDHQGNIYVADMGNHRIQKYDSKGKYIKTIGRKGQGPGEFEQPTKIVIDENHGGLFVMDNPKIKCFSQEGIYSNEVIFSRGFSDFCPTGKGRFLVVSSFESLSNSTRNLYQIEDSGKILHEYARHPFFYIVQGNLGNSFYASISGYEHDIFLANDNGGSFIYAFSEKYLLKVIDKNGQVAFAFGRDGKAGQLPAEMKKKYARSKFFNKFPAHAPFFYALFCDSEGRIYVQTNHALYEPGTAMACDVFSKNGYYLYRTELPPGTRVIKDGFLYASFIDKDSEIEYLKRLKIKNWNGLNKE